MAIVTDQSTFNALFWASRDPRLAALQNLKTPAGLPDIGARMAQAQTLASAGLVVIAGIDIDGDDPFFYMRDLASLGFVWQEALFQQPLPTDSILEYQDASKAYPKSVKISLNDADYPALVPPTPPPVEQSPIGAASGLPGEYGINAQNFYTNGVANYREGQASTPFTAPDGEVLYAHWGPSTLFWGWAWYTEAALAATKQAGG